MSFDKTVLKSSMLRDKEFLKELFQGNAITNAKLLNSADDVKLITLIKILHFIANGEIKIKKEFSEHSKQIRLLNKNFESKKSANFVVKSSRITKIKLLKQFVSSFNVLLYHIFNKD